MPSALRPCIGFGERERERLVHRGLNFGLCRKDESLIILVALITIIPLITPRTKSNSHRVRLSEQVGFGSVDEKQMLNLELC